MFNSRFEPSQTEDFYALHQKGSLALHLNVHPALYNDKFDNLCITNNEREDGGSTLNKDLGYTLHLIVSASLLPTPEYRVEQRLYENTGRYFFIGLNIEKCRINHFEVCDSHTTYQITNKHQRPSYKPTLFTDKINKLPHEQRVQHVHKKNKASADAVSRPTGEETDLFGIQEPTFIRPVNEILLKVNIDSMVCIGTTAAAIIQFPAIILDLIYLQNQLWQHLGIQYPIMIYNHTLSPVLIDCIVQKPHTLLVNQGIEVNVQHALIQMLQKYPHGIPSRLGEYIGVLNDKIGSTWSSNNPYSVQKFINYMQYSLDSNELPIVKTQEELQQALLQKQKNCMLQLNKVTRLLNQNLVPYQEDDHIIQMHKLQESKNDFEQYLEVNQKNLATFILKTYFPSYQAKNELVHDDDKKYFSLLTHAYNLQFRIQQYDRFLNSKNSNINYSKLEKDLEWAMHLIPNIVNREDKLFSKKPSLFCGIL